MTTKTIKKPAGWRQAEALGCVLMEDRGRRYWLSPIGGKSWVDTPHRDVQVEYDKHMDTPTGWIINTPGRHLPGAPRPQDQSPSPEEPSRD
ncbi:MAG: hypothetical protein U1E86_07665 [Burkholderiaceae bacterium]